MLVRNQITVAASYPLCDRRAVCWAVTSFPSICKGEEGLPRSAVPAQRCTKDFFRKAGLSPGAWMTTVLEPEGWGLNPSHHM